jgi:uncharacterized membrane protein
MPLSSRREWAHMAETERISDGFRLRGSQVTRLETFVDAAFAFSLTLLVIVFDDLPASISELRDALRQVPAFVFCFAILAMFWSAHGRWSRRFGMEDAGSTLLSLALVLVVMIYVYPLRMVASAAMAFFSGGWAPHTFAIDPAQPLLDLQTMFIVYALGFGLLAGILWALNARALQQADALGLDAHELFETSNEMAVHAVLAATALGSALASLLLLASLPHDALPGWYAALPAWLYALIGPAIYLCLYWRGRRRTAA